MTERYLSYPSITEYRDARRTDDNHTYRRATWRNPNGFIIWSDWVSDQIAKATIHGFGKDDVLLFYRLKGKEEALAGTFQYDRPRRCPSQEVLGQTQSAPLAYVYRFLFSISICCGRRASAQYQENRDVLVVETKLMELNWTMTLCLQSIVRFKAGLPCGGWNQQNIILGDVI